MYSAYQLPYKYFCSFTQAPSENKINSLVLKKKWLSNDKVRLKIQKINSRTAYVTTVSNTISNYDFIASCEKKSLIEIGYFSKVEEYKKIQQFAYKSKSKIVAIIHWVYLFFTPSELSENTINPNEFNYNFIDITVDDHLQACINLSIVSTQFTITVLFSDLIADANLLNNIYPPDLLKIGYELCTKELDNEIQPFFHF